MKFPKTNESRVQAEPDKKSEPQIFFGVSLDAKENFTCHEFEDFRDNYYARKQQNIVSPAFLKSLKNANYRVWLLDSYLIEHYIEDKGDKEGTNVVVKIFNSIVSNSHEIDVKVFLRKIAGSDEIEKLFRKKSEEINARRRGQVQTEIEYKYITQDFKQIHDRFCLIDNQLWHFGSDVGSSSPKFHATSFGWDAEELQVDKFFKELWENGL